MRSRDHATTPPFVVEGLGPDEGAMGLTEQTLHLAAASRLRAARIWSETPVPFGPYLYVNVLVIRSAFFVRTGRPFTDFGLPSATGARKRERRESSRRLHWRIRLGESRGRTSALIYSSAAGRSWSPGAPSWRSRRGSRPALGWPFSRSTHFPAIGRCGPRPARRPSRSARRLGGPSATSEDG